MHMGRWAARIAIYCAYTRGMHLYLKPFMRFCRFSGDMSTPALRISSTTNVSVAPPTFGCFFAHVGIRRKLDHLRHGRLDAAAHIKSILFEHISQLLDGPQGTGRFRHLFKAGWQSAIKVGARVLRRQSTAGYGQRAHLDTGCMHRWHGTRRAHDGPRSQPRPHGNSNTCSSSALRFYERLRHRSSTPEPRMKSLVDVVGAIAACQRGQCGHGPV